MWESIANLEKLVRKEFLIFKSFPVDSPESPTKGKHPEPTQEDKEKLYNVIADRLAEIGDSYAGTSPTGGSGRISGGESTSPVQAVTSQQLTSSYDMRDGMLV